MTKYSIKNICLGIGIGLIIAAMANLNAASRTLSKNEIISQAQQYGLVIMDAKDYIIKQPQNETAQPEPAKEPDKEERPQEQPKTPATVVLEIKRGATSETIADQLLEKKLVKSKQTFLERLTERKKVNKLQVGSFEIPSGASIDQIIDIITVPPK